MDWSYVVLDTVYLQAILITVMNFGFHKSMQFFDQLSNYQLFKKLCFMDLALHFILLLGTRCFICRCGQLHQR